jgi:hypothetical protein
MGGSLSLALAATALAVSTPSRQTAIFLEMKPGMPSFANALQGPSSRPPFSLKAANIHLFLLELELALIVKIHSSRT